MSYGRETSMIGTNRMPGPPIFSPHRVPDNRVLRIARTPLGTRATVPRAKEEGSLTLAAPCRYRSILVPVDGTSFAEHALPLALGIAWRAGAIMQVVHVHSPLQSAYKPDRLYYDSGLDAILERRQRAYLESLVQRLARVSSVLR
jgi:hypothetical protein